APTARNAIAWVIGPGWAKFLPFSAESAKCWRKRGDHAFRSTLPISRLQRFQNSEPHHPGPMAQAIAFRAVGAATWTLADTRPL
ncbi:MAG: hypothetical protein LC770_13615, partial [Acidobacteria bacterium]|nr:hypothetical protein [Acidobacteriota bacterium]